MKVVFGGTRVIFIFKDFVIKIPRFRIVRPILRFFYHLKNKQVEKKLEHYNKKSMMIAILKYFFLGLIANRLEYHYSKKHRNFGEIVPVYGILFGMILIQKRVVVMKEEDEQWKEFEESLLKKGIKDIDLRVAHNFGLDCGKIKVLDYGRIETIKEIYKLKFA